MVSQADEAQRIAFNATLTAQLFEERGVLRNDITLCFTAALFAMLVSYLKTRSAITLCLSKNNTHDTFFYGYPVKIVDSDEYAAYVSVATIK